jgi:hypothetical protein
MTGQCPVDIRKELRSRTGCSRWDSVTDLPKRTLPKYFLDPGQWLISDRFTTVLLNSVLSERQNPGIAIPDPVIADWISREAQLEWASAKPAHHPRPLS